MTKAARYPRRRARIFSEIKPNPVEAKVAQGRGLQARHA
jgi:hypothetical protein